MPELPEVETIRRQFEKELLGVSIRSVEIRLPKMVRGSANEFSVAVAGTRFTGAKRRSKMLVLGLSSGYSIIVHLKMSGQLVYVPSSEPIVKHTHVIFHLDNDRDLRLRDVRQFGYLKLVKENELKESPEFAGLGLEAIDPGFSPEKLKAVFSRRARSKIKAVLLDQSLISGLGNIYADESLFCARVRPERPAGTLTEVETQRLFDCARELLKNSIERRGTSFDLYVDLYNRRGENQNHLKVYGRAGEPCARCGATIERTRVAGRGTHYCPRCQK